MKFIHLHLLLIVFLLSGCAGANSLSRIEALNDLDVSGEGFGDALAREYRDMANYEWNKMYDYRNGSHFARKGLAAAAQQEVLPDTPESRDLPENTKTEIAMAHERLLMALSAGAATAYPDMTARAQSRFDCWIEQQEEGYQAAEIVACRSEFEDAMARIAAFRHMIFFDAGSSRLNDLGKTIIACIVMEAKAASIVKFALAAHTDTKGSAAANKALSQARARTVKAALVARGFAPGNITISAQGEGELLVKTADETDQAENRRVEVVSFK